MSTKTLAQITDAMLIVKSLLESGDGELSPELEALFDASLVEHPAKIDAYYHIMKRIEAEETYLKEREAEIRNCRKVLENHRERMKSNLKFHMDRLEQDEVCGVDYRFKLQGSNPALVIENENEVPTGYVQEVISTEIQKARIKEDLSMGIEVPGCSLQVNKSLRSYPMASPKKLKGA